MTGTYERSRENLVGLHFLEIAVFEGNFDHEILIFTERLFHVSNLTFCNLRPTLLIDSDLIQSRKNDVLEVGSRRDPAW